MNKKWGKYEVLLEGKLFKVKMLTLKPFSKSSLQKHNKRCEFWVYLDEPNLTHKFINYGEIHQLKNDTDQPKCILELQFGSECLEKDIERFKE